MIDHGVGVSIRESYAIHRVNKTTTTSRASNSGEVEAKGESRQAASPRHTVAPQYATESMGP
jgi:hypothetical protein